MASAASFRVYRFLMVDPEAGLTEPRLLSQQFKTLISTALISTALISSALISIGAQRKPSPSLQP